MNKITLLISGVALVLTACGSKSSDTIDLSDVPITEIVATHAFETQEAVQDLTFVPNDIAPWLGRLITTHPSGALYSTDVEGRNPDKMGVPRYKSVYALTRTKAAGVFLASSADKSLSAYIEVDDDGKFGSMTTSGPALDIKAFCSSASPTDNTVSILTTDGSVQEMSLAIGQSEDAQTQGLEYVASDPIFTNANAKQCAVMDETHFVVTDNDDNQTLHIVKDIENTTLNFAGLIDIAPVTLNASPYLIVLSEGKIILLDTTTNTVSRQISIGSGLSIMGIESADMVAATPSNYGGGAFSKGVIAFSNKDENRIVFVSLEYLESQIKG